MAEIGSEVETLSHVMRLVEAFRAFDSDNDGSITAAELGGIMASIGYNSSEQEVKEMMQRGDTNHDGQLSIEEFLDMNTTGLRLGSLGASLGSAFELADFETGDAVTGEDLHRFMQQMGTELSLADCQNIIVSMDGDGDGAVCFEDLMLIINSLL